MTAAALTLAEAARIVREFRHANRHCLTWLYAFQAGEGGPVKIGVTGNPSQRLATIQQAHFETLRPLATHRVVPVEEKWLHEQYAYARIRGEWFKPVPELLEYLAALGHTWDDWDLGWTA